MQVSPQNGKAPPGQKQILHNIMHVLSRLTSTTQPNISCGFRFQLRDVFKCEGLRLSEKSFDSDTKYWFTISSPQFLQHITRERQCLLTSSQPLKEASRILKVASLIFDCKFPKRKPLKEKYPDIALFIYKVLRADIVLKMLQAKIYPNTGATTSHTHNRI